MLIVLDKDRFYQGVFYPEYKENYLLHHERGGEYCIWVNMEVQNGDQLSIEDLTSGLKNNARIKRDQMLRETDRYMMPDYPNKPAGIEQYRQALRDITEQAGFPDNFQWPELASE